MGTMIWYQCFLPYIGQNENLADLKQLKIYRCRAFPKRGAGYNNVSNSKQTVCYVINAWTGSSTREAAASKKTRFRSPSSKVYLADSEAGTWRPVIESLAIAANEVTVRNDVYFSGHLPASTNETSHAYGRRIAANRHADGSNVLFVDGHAEQVKAEDITIRMFPDR